MFEKASDPFEVFLNIYQAKYQQCHWFWDILSSYMSSVEEKLYTIKNIKGKCQVLISSPKNQRKSCSFKALNILHSSSSQIPTVGPSSIKLKREAFDGGGKTSREGESWAWGEEQEWTTSCRSLVRESSFSWKVSSLTLSWSLSFKMKICCSLTIFFAA